jgi:hypothetical protein
MVRRTLRHAALLLALCATTAMPAHAAEPWTEADSEAAISEHSALAGCIAYAETGGTLDPYSVGRAGELGIAQLLPSGELQTFYRLGFDDPYSPWQALDFLDWSLARGRGHFWTTYGGCL